jgi:hypothetical protein
MVNFRERLADAQLMLGAITIVALALAFSAAPIFI